MILDKELRDMLTRAFNAGFVISREEIAEFARTAVDRLMREVL